MAVARIWCLRHAESLDNARGAPAGRGDGAGLSAAGQAQAAAAARRLQTEPVVAVYTSPALRARQTAGEIARHFGLSPSIQPELAECDVSSAVLRTWIVDGDLGIESSGETGAAAAQRVADVLGRTTSGHDGQSIVVVSHVAALTLGLLQLRADLTPDLVWGRPLPFAVPFLIERLDSTWRLPDWPTMPTAG